MHPVIADIQKKLKDLHGAQIITGVQGEPGINASGETIAADEELQKIAWVHEYGMDIEVTPEMRAWLHYNGIHLKKETTHIHIPERSYIRKAKSEGKADLNSVYNKQIQLLFEGKIDTGRFLKALGQQMVEEIIAGLGDGAKPVTQYTLEHRKESHNPTPLSDTGRLRRHITYRIAKAGEKGSGTTITRSGSG